MILELDLELLTDACFSTSNHTLGEPSTHQYIPGRTLWGAIASAAYRSPGFSEEEAFRLFHQGAVRILDAVPVLDGHRSYPVPLAWHEEKDCDRGTCHNFAIPEVRNRLKEKQCKGKKGGWVTANLHAVKVSSDYSLRTSVDPTGKAREGLLFGLPVLRAGSRFCGGLIGNESDVEKVANLLLDRELRVGRSKNSELGLVRVGRRTTPIGKLPHGSGTQQRVSFLCVSRCLFRNPASGAPTLIPDPGALGLDSTWEFDTTSSFLRTARMVHFNAKRGRPERERFGLERGSVLTFSGPHQVDVKELVAFTQLGVGEHRGEGYGEVLVAPPWLTDSAPIELGEAPAKAMSRALAKAPDDPLFRWAHQRALQRSTATDLYQTALAGAEDLRRFKVPSSQWGVIRRMAREARFRPGQGDRLFKELFDEKTGFLSTGKRNLSDRWEKAGAALRKACDKQMADLPMFLELVASACMRPGSERKGEMK